MKKILLLLAIFTLILLGIAYYNPSWMNNSLYNGIYTSKTQNNGVQQDTTIVCNPDAYLIEKQLVDTIILDSKLISDWTHVNKIFLNKDCSNLEEGPQKFCKAYIEGDLTKIKSLENVDPLLFSIFTTIMQNENHCGVDIDCQNQVSTIKYMLENRDIYPKTFIGMKPEDRMKIIKVYMSDKSLYNKLYEEILTGTGNCVK